MKPLCLRISKCGSIQKICRCGGSCFPYREFFQHFLRLFVVVFYYLSLLLSLFSYVWKLLCACIGFCVCIVVTTHTHTRTHYNSVFLLNRYYLITFTPFTSINFVYIWFLSHKKTKHKVILLFHCCCCRCYCGCSLNWPIALWFFSIIRIFLLLHLEVLHRLDVEFAFKHLTNAIYPQYMHFTLRLQHFSFPNEILIRFYFSVFFDCCFVNSVAAGWKNTSNEVGALRVYTRNTQHMEITAYWLQWIQDTFTSLYLCISLFVTKARI